MLETRNLVRKQTTIIVLKNIIIRGRSSTGFLVLSLASNDDSLTQVPPFKTKVYIMGLAFWYSIFNFSKIKRY